MIGRPEIDELWAKVRANSDRWHSCPRHHFPHEGPVNLGQKLTCDVCGAEARLTDIGNYIRGYIAAGGDPRDVMPAWNDKP